VPPHFKNRGAAPVVDPPF